MRELSFCFSGDTNNYSPKIPIGIRYIEKKHSSTNVGFVLNAFAFEGLGIFLIILALHYNNFILFVCKVASLHIDSLLIKYGLERKTCTWIYYNCYI